MEMKIDIFNYIDEDEIKELVRTTLVSQLKEQIKRETDRLIGNASYYCAYRIIDDLLTDEQRNEIRKNTTDIISKMSEFTVFYKSSWNRSENSTALYVVEQTVKDHRELITEKVKEKITNFDYDKALENDALGIIQEAIISKLTHKCEE